MPTNAQAPTPRLPPYASEIPAALLQFPDLSVPQANDEPDQVTIPETPKAPQAAADLPQAVPAAPEPPGAPSPTYPINIAPTSTTHTGYQVRTSARFGYAAYLAKLHLLVLPTSILWHVSKWSLLISNNQKDTQMQCPWKLH